MRKKLYYNYGGVYFNQHVLYLMPSAINAYRKVYEYMRHTYTTIVSYQRRNLLYDRLYTTCRSFNAYNIRYDTTLCDCRVAGVYKFLWKEVVFAPIVIVSGYSKIFVATKLAYVATRIIWSDSSVLATVSRKFFYLCSLGSPPGLDMSPLSLMTVVAT